MSTGFFDSLSAMTCICAVAGDGKVVMGGDSAVSSEDGDRSLRSPKVFERDGLLFGVSGELRAGQLIQHVFDLPRPAEEQDTEQFLIRDLCGGLRKSMQSSA